MTDVLPVATYVEIDKLFEIDNQIPPTAPSSHFETVTYSESVEAIYSTVYAPALDKFLETRWYTSSGLKVLQSNPRILAEFADYVKAATVQADEPSPPNILAHETRLIWHLLKLCHSSDVTSQSCGLSTENSTGSLKPGSCEFTQEQRPSGNDIITPTTTSEKIPMAPNSQLPSYTQEDTTTTSIETAMFPIETFVRDPSTLADSAHLIPAARLAAFTSLLTHSSPPSPRELPTQPLIPQSTSPGHLTHKPPTTLARQLQARETEFWSCVDRFATTSFPRTHQEPEQEKLSRHEAQRQALLRARQLLDSRENRDLVYTIMRMRWLQSLARPSAAAGERDTTLLVEGQLRLGMHLLKSEAGLADAGGDGVTSGTGTNVVAMRIAAMAVQAFCLESGG